MNCMHIPGLKILFTASFFYLYLSFAVSAQERDFTIVNKDGVPVDSAQVLLVDRTVGEIIWQCLSDKDGDFSLAHFPNETDSLYVNILKLDYAPFVSKVSQLPPGAVITLDSITYELEEAVVTGQAPVRLFDKGDILVDVKQMKNSDRLNTDQALQRIPGVTLSDGGARLYGVEADIYINDIQQTMNHETLMRYLGSLPSHAVDNIRLVSMPSAKYGKAQAVIDITLKTSLPDGLYSQGQIYGGIKGAMAGDFGVGEFLMFKKGRVTFNTSISYDNYNQWAQTSDSSYFSQQNRYISAKRENNGRLGAITSFTNMSVKMNNGQKLDFNAVIYWDHEKNTAHWRDVEGTPNESIATGSLFRSSTRGSDDMYSLTVKYSTDPTKRNYVSAYYSGMYGSLKDRGNYYSEQNEAGSWLGYLSTDYAMRGHQHFIHADAVSKLGERWQLEYGLRSSLGFLTDDTYNRDFATGEALGFLNFKGHEIIAGAYARIKYNITDNHGISLDAGYDYTWFTYKDSQNDAYNYNNNYGDIIPSLMYWLNIKNYNLAIKAHTRVVRPHYSYMLPGVRYVNEYMYNTGNPNLKNSNIFNVEVTQTFLRFLTLHLVYGRAKDYVEQYYGYDSTRDQVYTSYANLYDYNLFKVYLNCPYALWNDKIYGSLTVSYDHADAFNIAPEAECGDRTSWDYLSADLSFYYDITDRLSFNFIAAYNTPWKNRIQRSTDRHNFSFGGGLSYTFLKQKNLVLLLNASSLAPGLEERVTQYRFNDNVFSSFSKRLTSVSLAIRYNFSIGERVDFIDNSVTFERMTKR